MAAMVLSFGLLGVCLVGNLGRLPFVTLPSMPYASSLLLGMACLALAACAVVGCIYYFSFMRQFCKAYGRFHRNALSSSKGAPALPPLTHPSGTQDAASAEARPAAQTAAR